MFCYKDSTVDILNNCFTMITFFYEIHIYMTFLIMLGESAFHDLLNINSNLYIFLTLNNNRNESEYKHPDSG